MYDKSIPEIYETTISQKIEERKSKGGSSYYLVYEGWNNKVLSKKIKVDYKKYYSSFEGEKIKIAQKRGKFDIPWYYFVK